MFSQIALFLRERRFFPGHDMPVLIHHQVLLREATLRHARRTVYHLGARAVPLHLAYVQKIGTGAHAHTNVIRVLDNDQQQVVWYIGSDLGQHLLNNLEATPRAFSSHIFCLTQQ